MTSNKPNLADFLRSHGFQSYPNDGEFYRDGSKYYLGREHQVGGKTYTYVLIGDWATDLRESWESVGEGELSEAEHLALRTARQDDDKKMREERLRRQEEVSLECQALWDQAITMGETPYSVKKGLNSLCGARMDPARPSTLLIPIRDGSAKLWSFQRIHADGSKEFVKGGRIQGNYFGLPQGQGGSILGGPATDSTVLICEGYATGASLYRATKCLTFCAFSTSNLERVAVQVRSFFPQARILICADHDQWKDPTFNPGLEAGREAAMACQGELRYPEGLSEGLTDFNDLHLSCGLGVVRAAILDPPTPPLPPAPAAAAAVLARPEYAQDLPEPLLFKQGKKVILPPQQLVADQLIDFYGERLLAEDRELFLYGDRHWKHLQEGDLLHLRCQLQYLCRDLANDAQLRSILNLVIMKARRVPGLKMFAPRPMFVNFLDGTLCLKRGSEHDWQIHEFREHRLTDYLLNVIPLSYLEARRGGIDSSKMDETLENIFGGDPDRAAKIRQVGQMFGACLAPLIPHLFLLHGPSGTGKSTLILLATRLLHEDNICSVQPHEFGGFHLENMVGKLVNYRTDISLSHPITDDTIKLVEDRDPNTRIDRKFKTALKAPIPAIHIFGANGIPDIKDAASRAQERRWSLIKLDSHRTKLGAYTHDYANMVFDYSPSAVLRFALAGLEDLLNTGHYLVTESGTEDMEDWHIANDPVAAFLAEIQDGCCEIVKDTSQMIEGPGLEISGPDLWRNFDLWHKAAYNSPPKFGKIRFFQRMCSEKYARVMKNHKQNYFIGLCVTGAGIKKGGE